MGNMGLAEGFRQLLAGIFFLATSLSLLYGFSTLLMGAPWDSPAERLSPVLFLFLALLLAKAYTWLIRQSESGSMRLGKHPRVPYRSVLGYAALAAVLVWGVTFSCRWLFPPLRRASIGIFLFVASIVVLLIHHFVLQRDRGRMA